MKKWTVAKPALSPQREKLAIIHRSGEYLLELINDVLELSKIEAARDTLTESAFDLYDTLEKVTEMIRLRAEKKNLQLIFERSDDVPRFIKTDERKLRQIMLNLMGNAVKFTREGGVTLRVRSEMGEHTRKDDGSLLLRFEVEDSGPGIATTDRAGIFEALTQAQSGYDKKEGTGLGLPISLKYAELMGGTIEIDSKVGRGTCFTFEMRLAPAQRDVAESHRLRRRVIGLAAGQPVIRLLVVEDNMNNRKLLVTLLQSVGFEVQQAVNGREAVEIWRQWRPHLIWMDIRMPVLDGYAATEIIRAEIRQTDCGLDTRIIALTASAFEEDRVKVIEHGANDFVRKPFRESEIFEMIHKHLGVAYIFEQEKDPVPIFKARRIADGDLTASIQDLPKPLLARLKEATELSDAVLIDGVIKEISAKDNELAGVLLNLAANFAYDKILELIQGP